MHLDNKRVYVFHLFMIKDPLLFLSCFSFMVQIYSRLLQVQNIRNSFIYLWLNFVYLSCL